MQRELGIEIAKDEDEEEEEHPGELVTRRTCKNQEISPKLYAQPGRHPDWHVADWANIAHDM